MAMQDDALHEALEFFRVIKSGGCLFHARIDLFEAGCAQARSSSIRIRELPQRLKSSEDFSVGLGREEHLHPAQQPGDVRTSAALCTEPPSRTKCSIQFTKKPLVVAHPVEGSSAENAVKFLLERLVQNVAANKFNPPGKIGLEIRPGLIDHVLRKVKRNDAASWQGFQQVAGQTACAAARVENSLISTKRDTSQYLLAPTDLRRGYLMVKRCVPFARVLRHSNRVLQTAQ